MGTFADNWGNIDVEKEKSKFTTLIGGDQKLLGSDGIPDDVQLVHIEKLAKDMTWLERFSAPFKRAFKEAATYEMKRQISVMSEWFQKQSDFGHEKIKLYMKHGDMTDHMVEYDDSGSKSGLNSAVVISGKVNQFKCKVGLDALKKKGTKTLTVYLKKRDMTDHFVELNDNGVKIPFLEKCKELTK